jgi:hypothetical protein
MSLISIKNRFLQQLDLYSLKPSLYSFILSEKSKQFFDQVIKSSSHYLEFGMGGSTIRVLQESKSKVYTVESSIDWIGQMRKYLLIKYMVVTKRLQIFHVDIGKTGSWGSPIGNYSKHLYPNYSSSIFNCIDKRLIDTVFIDGRFRVACVMKTILECCNNEKLVFLIHDFQRKEYHIVLKYLEEDERCINLVKFHLKKDIDLNSVEEDYEKYKFDPR